jgi:hypothetical protein
MKKGRRPTRIYGKGTVHQTISIPKKVKQQMDLYAEHHYVNWSQIAVEAYTRFLKGKKK